MDDDTPATHMQIHTAFTEKLKKKNGYIAELETALANVLNGRSPIQSDVYLKIDECAFCGGVDPMREDDYQHSDDCEWANGWKVLNKSNGE